MIRKGQPVWNQQTFNNLLLRWIVQENQSFRSIESPALQLLLLYQWPSTVLLTSGDTIRKWVMQDWDNGKDAIKEFLKARLTTIHLSLDAWTTLYMTMAMLGITAHFVGLDGKLYSIVLSLEKLEGPHSGQNMSEYTFKVIQDYEIQQKLGYLVMDNASSNDTLIRELQVRVNWTNWKAETHRLHCFKHILNLSVRAFWSGEGASVTDEVHDTIVVHSGGSNEETIEDWQKKGPWGKLHNLCIFIRGSSQRRAEFYDLSAPKMVVSEGATRWNSGYKMVSTGLKLQKFIDLFCSRYPKLEHDILSFQDWEDLAAVKGILKPFLQATHLMEARSSTISKVIPLLEFLVSEYKNVISKYGMAGTSQHMHLVQSANLGLAKLDRYYNKIRQIPVYLCAVILDPSSKFEFIESTLWTADEIKLVKEKVISVWQDVYKTQDRPSSSSTKIPGPESMKKKFDQWRASRRKTVQVDQLEQYLAAPVEPEMESGTELDWWYRHRETWPQLAQMALDILSIPAMSADPERLFSSAKMAITENRVRLNSDSLNALECLKSWEWEGILKSPVNS